jgi:hypothetical protein
MRRASVWACCAVIAMGCAGEGGAARPSAIVSPAAVGEATQRIDVEPVLAASPEAAPDGALLTIHATEPGMAEDGQGRLAQAPTPVAIDLDGHVFRPRALDPVLTIGPLSFTHYSHPHPGVLRFVIADASLLVTGGTIRVHYARDASDARTLVDSIGQLEQSAARQP